MTAVVYYSLEGNTDFIAKKIAEKTGAELIRLIPKKEYPTGNVSKFVWGGRSAVFGEKPELLNKKLDLQKYDTLIIGTPVWAGKFTPPLNTFLHKYEIECKNIFLFACHSGGGAERCFLKMKDLLVHNRIIGTMDFTNPFAIPKDDTDKKVEEIFHAIQIK